MVTPSQEVSFRVFEKNTLEGHLELHAPPFGVVKEPFRQLRYIEKYVHELGCKSIAIEGQYIDRDYIEDHSIFYARNFFRYDNSCKRVHFFSVGEDEIKERLTALLSLAASANENAYRDAYEAFSEEVYLGFTVIKPLHGCPVGRTVLRTYAKKSADNQEFHRAFGPTRRYRPHFMGIELCVQGLGFQQQDTGVSACATTALWSALQKVRDFEDVATATPAQITTLASQHSLPFGRTMPSEGLSVNQMCQAIQALGLSPNLFKTDRLDMARGLLYSSIMSEMAPILILRSDRGSNHAVTAVGVKLRNKHITKDVSGYLDECSNDLLAMYIHDDRHGPYLTAKFAEEETEAPPWLKLNAIVHGEDTTEEWNITHVLIPMHSKIRLSFQSLRDVGTKIVAAIIAFIRTNSTEFGADFGTPILLDTRIVRSFKYIKELLFKQIPPEQVKNFCSTFHLPRYVGVIRVKSELTGEIDVLVDTTDTPRNLHCLSVVELGSSTRHTASILRFLAERYNAGVCSSV